MRRLFFLTLLLLSTVTLAEPPQDWSTLTREAYKLHKAGQGEQAVLLAEQAIQLAGETGDPLAVGTAKNTLGLIYLEREDYYQAEKRFQVSAAAFEADPRMGPEHEFTAHIYKNLALCLDKLGRYKEAEEFFRKALHNYQLLDQNRYHPDTLDIVKGLADCLLGQARYKEARELYEEVVEKSEADSLAVHQSRQGLADILTTLGRFKEAEALLLPVLTYYEDTESPSVQSFDRLAIVLGALGAVRLEQGDFKAAEANYKRAVDLKRRTSPNLPSLAAALNNLALLYTQIGDLQRAEPLYEEALSIHRKALGEVHPRTSTSLNNLALLLSEKKEYERAEEMLQQALKIERELRDGNHPSVARALSNLGSLYLKTRRPKEALPLYKSAVDILQPLGGPDYATALSNLGSVYHELGRLEEAGESFRAALSIAGPDAAFTFHNNLAYLLIDQGRPEEALKHAEQAANVLFGRLKNVFSFTSERQRLDFKRTLQPYGLLVTLDRPRQTFQAALRFKGAVLDSIVEDRRLALAARDPELQALLDSVEFGKRELLQLELENGVPERQAALRKSVEDSEATLARKLASFEQQRTLFKVTPEQVQRALPPETVLVEFLYHGYYLGENRSERRYSALVVPPSGDIKLVPLGTEDEVNEKVGNYRNQVLGLRSPTRASRVVLADNQAGQDPAALSELNRLIWEPVEKVLPPSTNSLLLSPDGELNFVSFATLLDSEQRFLTEKYSLSYLSSGRDLVMRVEPSEGKDVRLFGNPDYGEHKAGVEGVFLSPLPGTEKECRTLQGVFQEQQPVMVLGPEALESAVRDLVSPGVLHIATHGLFLSEALGPRNPMSRSGLAFTGAQVTLDDWVVGAASDPEKDGFLTAEEVGQMELAETRLVVLSACDTGLGASENGEGVLGLRRGFVKSGAQNLLFTLWPIDDEETARFMVDFYRLQENQTPREALNQTQKEWLVRLKESDGPIRAARLAGPFVLSTVGVP